MADGNIEWLRERAQAIRAGHRPKTEAEWQAVADGMDMIADAMQQIFDTIGEVAH